MACVTCHLPILATGMFAFECSECSLRVDALLDVVCNVCFKSFLTKKQRRDHMRVHGPRTHQCPECHMAYQTASKLSAHRLTHSKTRYHCEGCGAVFAHRMKLTMHQLWPCGPLP